MLPKSNISRNFSQEMAGAHQTLKQSKFAPALKPITQRLANFSAPGGPHAQYAAALPEWRSNCIFYYDTGLKSLLGKLVGNPTRIAVGQREGILAATGDYVPFSGADCNQFSQETRAKLAALTFCLHLHQERKFSDDHTISVLALPPQFKDWPSNAFRNANGAEILTLLAVAEKVILNEKMREMLADAVFYAAAYLEKAIAFLDTDAASTKIRKWFADENTTEAEITFAKSQLRTGARKGITVLHSKKLVLTDHPQIRQAVGETKDAKLRASEAFVFQKGDPVSTIYIQGGFFKESRIINGTRNYARIIIHELMHREMHTTDHRYATKGIRPNAADLPFSNAISNSDSWAFCFMDLSGQLLDFEASLALKNGPTMPKGTKT